jgi:hypothetical protein
MRFALWIAGVFLTFIAIRIGWMPFLVAAQSGGDPMVYSIAMQQVGAAALFLVAGCVLIGSGCIVAALSGRDGGKLED